MKGYSINLPYYRQGDDLLYFLNAYRNNVEALRGHSLVLAYAARQLNEIADVLSEFPDENVTIDAYRKNIDLYAPNDVINKLLKKELIIECDHEEIQEEIDEDLDEGRIENIPETNQFYMEW